MINNIQLSNFAGAIFSDKLVRLVIEPTKLLPQTAASESAAANADLRETRLRCTFSATVNMSELFFGIFMDFPIVVDAEWSEWSCVASNQHLSLDARHQRWLRRTQVEI